MKAVILAGGKGTRIGEESRYKPKPMIEIGSRPILWHIMKRFEAYGIREFIICCGYKGDMIKKYFADYQLLNADLTVDLTADLKEEKSVFDNRQTEKWKVSLISTGRETLTAGRILQIKDYVGEETFLLTYGDGVADIRIDRLLEFHKKTKKKMTISVTKPLGRFGTAKVDDHTKLITAFKEKAREDQNLVNIGYMVCEPDVFPYLGDGTQMLEEEPFDRLVEDGEIAAYEHDGFWSPMDNLKDRYYLEELWRRGDAPWMKF